MNLVTNRTVVASNLIYFPGKEKGAINLNNESDITRIVSSTSNFKSVKGERKDEGGIIWLSSGKEEGQSFLTTY